MCGIAGFEIDGVDVPAASAALMDALSARGPDARWSVVRGSVALVETRLAVIDLSDEVVYPMANESGDVHLIFNGEIYDHDVLRRDLEGRGHRFRTRCDAEVVLHGYEEWGIDVFPRLNGMFALAIIDERNGDVLLARDRLGIKPLVRTTGARFAFASDAIALVEAGLSGGHIDLAALQGFAIFHYAPPPATGIVDIAQVAAGTAIRRRRDGSEEEIVWGETPFAEEAQSNAMSVEEAEQALLTAVRRQLVADVEVGVFLSGGLGSTLVLSAAAGLGARPQAFSLGFAGHGDYDEAEAASRVASRLGVPHHVAQFSASFDSAVNAVADAYDTPSRVDFDDLDWLSRRLDRLWPRRHLRIFVDEFGWNTEHEALGWLYYVPRKKQAADLRKAYAMAAKFGRVDTMCWYQLYDAPPDRNSSQWLNWTSGLRTWDGVRKPAWQAFARAARRPSRLR